jgi:hypothetical protein
MTDRVVGHDRDVTGPVCRQDSDGCFRRKWDYGTTVFVGESVRQREVPPPAHTM